MKFSVKNFFCKCDQNCSFLRIWSHLLKKSLMRNFIVCAVIRHWISATLREKSPNTEKFLVRMFTHSDWIFSPYSVKYGPEITLYLDTFHVMHRVQQRWLNINKIKLNTYSSRDWILHILSNHNYLFSTNVQKIIFFQIKE